jgi:hypothetical protein
VHPQSPFFKSTFHALTKRLFAFYYFIASSLSRANIRQRFPFVSLALLENRINMKELKLISTTYLVTCSP